MALAMLATMAALGVVYLTLWSSAAEDLTRLLPASTRAYAAAPAPWAAMTRTLQAPIWRDKEALAAQVLKDGYLARERVGEIAGLPIESVRELLRNMDRFELALVPTTEGDTLLLFVEMRDATARRRVLARLKPLLETVDRRVGFRVDRVRQRPWQSLVGAEIAPPRVVDMEPWIVVSWGSPVGLEELLDARVEGRHDQLVDRPGFAADDGGGADLRLAVDASSAWRLLGGGEAPAPGGLVEYLDLLTFESRPGAGADVATLRAEITDRDLALALQRGLRARPHRLPALAPAEALSVLAASGDDLAALIEVLRGLAFRLQRDLEPPPEVEALAGILTTALADLPAGPGEVALIVLPPESPDRPPSPLVLVSAEAPELLAEALTLTVPARLGDGFAHGEVMHRGEPLHLELPHPTEDSAFEVEVGLAWRVRAGLLELAPDVATLDRFADATERLRDSPRLAMSRRGLPAEAAITWLADRRIIAEDGQPLPSLVSDRLREDFAFGVTLDALSDHLAIRSNLGLWTLATALASGTREEIDDITLVGLEPRCREAYDAFCALYPEAVPCRPFTLGRRARIEAVCRALFQRR